MPWPGLDLAGKRGDAAVRADVDPGVVRPSDRPRRPRRQPRPSSGPRQSRRSSSRLPVSQRRAARLRPATRGQIPGLAGLRLCSRRSAPAGPPPLGQQLRLLHQLGRPVHRLADPRIGAAPADVAGQLGVDPGVVGMRRAGRAAPRCRSASPACRSRTATRRPRATPAAPGAGCRPRRDPRPW